jgi:sodium transport system permease protein
MRRIAIIFKKELKDTLRDRRTLFLMVLFPLALYPVLITVFANVERSRQDKLMAKELTVAFIDYGHGAELRQLLEDPANRFVINKFEGYDEVGGGDTALLRQLIRDEEVDAAIILSDDFDRQVDSFEAADVQLVVKVTDENNTMSRVEEVLDKYVETKRTQRYADLSLTRGFNEVLKVEHINLATPQEMMGVIGAILPYFFIVFCLMGSMYPAIDLGAGEKERGTVETLITSPASRIEILLGKLAVVMCAGLLSALLSVVGIVIAVGNADATMAKLVEVLYSFMEVKSVVLILLMLVPLAIFFASLLLSISIYAKSFKEAQSLITPLYVVIIMPAVIGMMPGSELDYVTAAIPVLNITLGTKAIIAGTITPALYIECMLSLLTLAALGVIGSIRWFGKESNILRG